MKKSTLERLPTFKLDELLQGELNKDDPDGEQVRNILRVLEEREKDCQMELTPQIQAAWDKFASEVPGRTDQRKPATRSRVRRFVSMTATAAVLCVVLFGFMPQPAKAETWWEKLFNFTDSVFQFFSSAEKDEVHADYVFKTDNTGLQEVYNAVVELGVTDPVVPMWLPEGFELVECTTRDSKARTSVYAIFDFQGEKIVYELKFYDKNVWHEYQKDNAEIIEHEQNGIIHKVMENNHRLVAVWGGDKIECFLSAACSQDVFFKMINSIYNLEVA